MQKSHTYTVNEALQKLQNYCAYQERCHSEVQQKLKDMNMIPEAIDQIIVSLINDNYLNETRFAQTFVRGKFRIKKWGKHRLTLELKKKGISKFNIKKAIGEIEDGEYITVFNNLAKKRSLQIKETNKTKKKRKLADYLLYRGWESHMVYEKVNELV